MSLEISTNVKANKGPPLHHLSTERELLSLFSDCRKTDRLVAHSFYCWTKNKQEMMYCKEAEWMSAMHPLSECDYDYSRWECLVRGFVSVSVSCGFSAADWMKAITAVSRPATASSLRLWNHDFLPSSTVVRCSNCPRPQSKASNQSQRLSGCEDSYFFRVHESCFAIPNL